MKKRTLVVKYFELSNVSVRDSKGLIEQKLKDKGFDLSKTIIQEDNYLKGELTFTQEVEEDAN